VTFDFSRLPSRLRLQSSAETGVDGLLIQIITRFFFIKRTKVEEIPVPAEPHLFHGLYPEARGAVTGSQTFVRYQHLSGTFSPFGIG